MSGYAARGAAARAPWPVAVAVRMNRLRLALAVLLLALTFGACRREQVTYDFVERFPRADVETGLIDLGTPEARGHLIEGWSYDEQGPGGLSFVWGTGDRSSLRVFVTQPRPLVLALRGWSLPFEGVPPQRVAVRVNEIPADAVDVAPEPAEYRVAVPAGSWVFGENRIELHYAHHSRPVDLDPGARDPRPLAVAWDWLRIEHPLAAGEPHIERSAASSALVLPFGSRVEYYAKLHPESVLDIEGITRWGNGPDAAAPEPVLLEVRVEGDAVEPRTFELPVRSGARGRSRLSLEIDSERVARVSLRALRPEAVPGARAGLRLIAPTLRSRGARGGDGAAGRRASAAARRPNIVLYLIDTLRADRLGCYGNAKPVSPHIDAFAAEATRFARAIAQSSWTRASVASILTGLHPAVHGANRRQDALPLAARTLAERLEAAGYQTAGLVANGNVAREFGFAQGFEVYELELDESDRLNARAFDWLDRRRDGRPFFLYLHAVDPHAPYTPHSPYLERLAPGVPDPGVGSMETLQALEAGRLEPESRREDLAALYDVDIAFNDESFGALLRKLRALGLYDSSLIVLVSDHGEEFYEHGGWQHGETLYREQLDVPLIVKLPGQEGAGRVVSAPVQLVDLVPTILAYLGEDPPAGLQGRNLLPAMRVSGDEPWDRDWAFAHLDLDGREKEAVVTEELSLVETLAGDRPRPAAELFDRSRDPGEQRNLARERPIAVAYLRSLLLAAKLAAPSPLPREEAEVSEKLEGQLRALGYLE
jgi:arylsulfatase A-like enzyme